MDSITSGKKLELNLLVLINNSALQHLPEGRNRLRSAENREPVDWNDDSLFEPVLLMTVYMRRFFSWQCVWTGSSDGNMLDVIEACHELLNHAEFPDISGSQITLFLHYWWCVLFQLWSFKIIVPDFWPVLTVDDNRLKWSTSSFFLFWFSFFTLNYRSFPA